MSSGDGLRAFRNAYRAATDADERLVAIWHYRAAHPDAPAAPDAATFRLLLVTLLEHAECDAADARLAAARLLRHLWRGLTAPARELMFRDVTTRLLATRPALGREEGEIVWEAVEDGFAAVSAAAVQAICLDLLAGQMTRGGAAATTGTPTRVPAFAPGASHDVGRLIVRYAPGPIWPDIVRDLWVLYGIDIRCTMRLGSTSFWQEVGRGLLRRTLQEARPDDLRDAAPCLIRWLEDLASTASAEEELAPLLPALSGWALPAVARALQRGSEGWWFSREFRREVARVAAEMRTTLAGQGAEVTPARTVVSTSAEAVPAPAREEGREPVSIDAH